MLFVFLPSPPKKEELTPVAGILMDLYWVIFLLLALRWKVQPKSR
jgi:hypothetical protein